MSPGIFETPEEFFLIRGWHQHLLKFTDKYLDGRTVKGERAS